MTSQPGYQRITMYVLPNISWSKATRQWIPEKVTKILQSAGQNWMLKTQSFG